MKNFRNSDTGKVLTEKEYIKDLYQGFIENFSIEEFAESVDTLEDAEVEFKKRIDEWLADPDFKEVDENMEEVEL